MPKTKKQLMTKHIKEIKVKSMSCKNQACLLNKNCKCQSPQVTNNLAPCANKNVKKEKMKEKEKGAKKNIIIEKRESTGYYIEHNRVEL